MTVNDITAPGSYWCGNGSRGWYMLDVWIDPTSKELKVMVPRHPGIFPINGFKSEFGRRPAFPVPTPATCSACGEVHLGGHRCP